MLSQERRQRNQETIGTILKNRRVAEGYTQKALGDALGLEYYSLISQMELGYISVPPSLWVPIANALRMDRAEWVLRCLSEISPEIYSALFGNKSRMEVQQVLNGLYKGGFEGGVD